MLSKSILDSKYGIQNTSAVENRESTARGHNPTLRKSLHCALETIRLLLASNLEEISHFGSLNLILEYIIMVSFLILSVSLKLKL